MSDPGDDVGPVAVLNLWAVAGVVVAAVVAAAGLFSLPFMQEIGIDTETGFLLATAIEGLAAGLVILSIQYLHTERG